jgi:hypothetical protein
VGLQGTWERVTGLGSGRHSTTDDLLWISVVYHNTWEFVATKNTPMDIFQTPPTQQKCLLFYWPLIFLSRTFYVLVLLVATLSPMYNLSTPRMHSSVLGILVSRTIDTLLLDLLCSNHCICGVMQTVPSSQQKSVWLLEPNKCQNYQICVMLGVGLFSNFLIEPDWWEHPKAD